MNEKAKKLIKKKKRRENFILFFFSFLSLKIDPNENNDVR
jgi:hypothetical protein